MTQPIAIALHGGAGARKRHDYTAEVAHMRELVRQGHALLAAGAAAIDVVQTITRALELSGLYVAGKGSSPNAAGRYELDAAIMDGRTTKAGGVAALVGFESPIDVARAVMDHTPHALLAGVGAANFAETRALTRISDPEHYYTRAGQHEANHAPGALAHGTVGCVALDQHGHLAAATSTGGVFNKLPGRVGDTPIIGAGVFANTDVAISCTGQGEYFMRGVLAYDVAARVRYGGADLKTAADAAIFEGLKTMNGDGGMIAVDRFGHVCTPYNSEGMKRAWIDGSGAEGSAAFEA